MLNVVAVGSLIAALLVPVHMFSEPPAEDQAPPVDITVEVVTVNGSGCPAAQGTAVVSADRRSVRVTSPAYVAWVGDEADPTDFRQNCQLALSVTRPAGMTYAVAGVDSSGYAHLAAGATGVSRVSLYFQGASPTVAMSHAFAGPYSDTWQTSDSVDPPSRIYAPCDVERYLNVNTELRVNRGTSDRAATSFLARGPETALRLVWRRCAA